MSSWDLDEEARRVQLLRQRVDEEMRWRADRDGSTWRDWLWWLVPFYWLVRLIRAINRHEQGSGR